MTTKRGRKPMACDKNYDPVFGQLLTDAEVARRLSWRKATLQIRRAAGEAVPSYVKFSKRTCLTPESAVTEFIKRHFVESDVFPGSQDYLKRGQAA